MIGTLEYQCCVCGARLPHLPKNRLLELGAALKRDDQILYFCINRHTPEEITQAIQGVPEFKTANEIKNS
jgi:hypothetical protein